MNTYKITVEQTTPNGARTLLTLDVLGATVDLALSRVYNWYNRSNEYLENGNNEVLTLHPNIPVDVD